VNEMSKSAQALLDSAKTIATATTI